MKVRVTKAVPSDAGIILGLAIEGSKKAWLRFAAVEVTVELLDLECRAALTRALNRAVDRGAAYDLALDVPIPFDVTDAEG